MTGEEEIHAGDEEFLPHMKLNTRLEQKKKNKIEEEEMKSTP